MKIGQKIKKHQVIADGSATKDGELALGRRVMDGARQVTIMGRDGKVEVVTINCGTEKLEGFSGHSDYNQLMSYVQRLRPKLRRVLVNHGERRKSQNLSSSINRMFRVTTHYPQVQEAIKLF